MGENLHDIGSREDVLNRKKSWNIQKLYNGFHQTTFLLLGTQLRKWKDKPWTGKKYLHNIYLTKTWCAEYKELYIIIIKRKTVQFLKMGKLFGHTFQTRKFTNSKPIKKCSMSSVIWEVQSKTTVTYQYIPTRTSKIKKANTSKC